MNRNLIFRAVFLAVFIYLFTIGINRIYKDKNIDYISTSLIFYDLFMPYILGIVLAVIGKFHFVMNKNKLIFMTALNIVIFLVEIVVMAAVKLAIATEVYVLISLCLAFVINTTLLELGYGRK